MKYEKLIIYKTSVIIYYRYIIEMIAIWCMTTWQSMNSPPRINLIECGPGNGTLMKDILRAISNFTHFKKAVSVSMVEISEKMRSLQRETLGCPPIARTVNTSPLITNQASNINKENDLLQAATSYSGVSVSWFPSLRQIPIEPAVPILIIGTYTCQILPTNMCKALLTSMYVQGKSFWMHFPSISSSRQVVYGGRSSWTWTLAWTRPTTSERSYRPWTPQGQVCGRASMRYDT